MLLRLDVQAEGAVAVVGQFAKGNFVGADAVRRQLTWSRFARVDEAFDFFTNDTPL